MRPGLSEIVRGVQQGKFGDEGGAGDDSVIGRTEQPQHAEQSSSRRSVVR